jgi:TolA-binding protein
MYKVKDHNNLLRDPSNQAIINVDREKLSEHRNKKQMKDNIEYLNEEIASLKSDFQEIKFLLQQIASRG